MCDYGKIRKENLKQDDIKEILNDVFNNFKKLPEVLLLNCLGSVLDTEEMPIENIITLLDELSNINIDVIIFETHYLTINASILSLIKQKLYNILCYINYMNKENIYQFHIKISLKC